MVELKSCPFCGSVAVVTIKPRGFRVECSNRSNGCPVNMRTHHKVDANQAKTQWNTRVINKD